MIALHAKSLHPAMFDADRLRQELAKSGQLAELEKTYDHSYPEVEISTSHKWDELAGMSSVPEIRIRRLTRVADLVGGGSSILDIGPGWGNIIPILAANDQDLDYTGIDFSPTVIERLSKEYPDHRFVHASLDDFPPQRFKTILVLEVLEHIVPSQALGFLRQVRERLEPGGELIVTAPVDEDLEDLTFVCGHCGKPMNKMGHVRVYSKELIKAELQLAGFSVVHDERMYVGYYGLKGAIKRRLRNTLGRLIGPADFKQAKTACVILKCVVAPAQDGEDRG